MQETDLLPLVQFNAHPEYILHPYFYKSKLRELQ